MSVDVAEPVDLEADWLRTTADGLPALLAADGGPWDVVQPWVTRTPPAKKTAIYLTVRSTSESRYASHRKIIRHEFRGELWWPIGATTTTSGLWESEQRAFHAAVRLLVARVRGTAFDHTHGDRFLSVAETPAGSAITVDYGDQRRTLSGSPACLTADITYSADSADFTA